MKRTRSGWPVMLALSALVAGCAAPQAAPSADARREDASSPFDTLDPSELDDIHTYSALRAIEERRPRWLRGRGPSVGVDTSGEEPVVRAEPGEERVRVYVDGIGRDLEALDFVPLQNVASMRFLSASEASMRFGIGHDAGAILVTTRIR